MYGRPWQVMVLGLLIMLAVVFRGLATYNPDFNSRGWEPPLRPDCHAGLVHPGSQGVHGSGAPPDLS